MKHFLIVFDDISIDKASVKSGDNSPEVITAVRCVNVGLFVSGDLRRDVVVSFAIGTSDDLMIISFPGDGLKRVSPDEKSISFFLLKAFAEAEILESNSMRTLDNGIEIRRTSLLDFVELCSPKKIYVANSEIRQVGIERFEFADSLLIYSNAQPINLELENRKWDLMYLQRPSHAERFILDVNISSDMNTK